MTVAESVVKLSLGKDKLGFSKYKERGVCEKDHKEDNDGNGIDDNGGSRKPLVGKKKPNRKMDKLIYFLYNSLHMLKKYLKKSILKEKPVGKALVLGSSARGVEAKEAESEKKPVKCFLCHGSYRLRKCLKKSVIEGDNIADKEPKKLGSSKGVVKAKRAKRSKKKQVKWFLYGGPHELRNCPKQAVVKEKATSELDESLKGLPPKEDVSLSSNLGEKVAMKIVKLEKEVMEVGQLTRISATSRTVRVKKRRKPRQKSRRKGKAKVSR
ncbi:hypothetical protein Gotur_013876 [Gossypium turneri]